MNTLCPKIKKIQTLVATVFWTKKSGNIELLGGMIGFLVGWLWFTIPESSKWQATVGKKMLGLKVTDENGERIGFGRANARYWSKIISFLVLCVGYLMVAFTERKQGLHDKIAGTLVVKVNR